MTTALEFVQSLQDGVLKTVETSQRWRLGALKATTSAIEKVLPPAPPVPFAEYLPTPEDTVELTFGFAERLLAAQHSFATEVAELGRQAPGRQAPAKPAPAKRAAA
jgi:hypothetical protein